MIVMALAFVVGCAKGAGTELGNEADGAFLASGGSSSELGDTEEGSELGTLRLDLGGEVTPGGSSGGDSDPATCAQAAESRSYVGCEFWPTVTFNPVLENFDFAAAVANGSDGVAHIVVRRGGPGGPEVAQAEVQPGRLEKIILPWVPELKGPQFDAQTTGPRPKNSVRLDGGAYFLTSTMPVSVWQFNPLQYTDDPAHCAIPQDIQVPGTCLSVSNDASLLIPKAAMRGTYRVMLKEGAKGTEGGFDDTPGSVAVTATEDGTELQLQLPVGVEVTSGPGVPAIAAGGEASFRLNAGDVLQLMAKSGAWWGELHHDLSGSLIVSDKPVQVISTVALTSVPSPEITGEGYADHLEELILPAEVLGDRYLVAPPSSSQGQNIGHYVRFYGNFDGTVLTYAGSKPSADAPDRLEAGQVVSFETQLAFEVVGTKAFGVAMFGKGGQRHTPNVAPTSGDPAFSVAVAIEQFRSRYIFLAPTDYLVSYADVIMPVGASVLLDGREISGHVEAIAGTQWQVLRHRLDATGDGAHILQAQGTGPDGAPVKVGLQVMGYGHATGYMYPGGMNLDLISDPPMR